MTKPCRKGQHVPVWRESGLKRMLGALLKDEISDITVHAPLEYLVCKNCHVRLVVR